MRSSISNLSTPRGQAVSKFGKTFTSLDLDAIDPLVTDDWLLHDMKGIQTLDDMKVSSCMNCLHSCTNHLHSFVMIVLTHLRHFM